jgi:transposase
MLTQEEDIDAHALHKRGWTISAIARHLDRDRKTIRSYLNGDRQQGVRTSGGEDRFERFVPYVTERLREDPHLWALTLFDELGGLGYSQSYPTLTRQIRNRGLRPHCEACSVAKHRPVAVIEHPPGEEIQWDWLELPDPPAAWGFGSKACLLVGALAHSGKWRGVLCESMDQAHLIDALDRISRQLGGIANMWRFDRMATVCHPATGRVTASFAQVAKHYGVSVAICPPRHGNRKGVVEKANHTAAQRWWRTLPDDVTVEEAQSSLERFCTERADMRQRVIDDRRATVAVHAGRERLRPVPQAPFPATVSVERKASAQALVAFRGNRYSVPPELAHAMVTVAHRLGSTTVDIATTAGVVVARHRLAVAGAGVMVRDHVHVTALDRAAMAAFSAATPHRRKQRIPPGSAALAAAAQLTNTSTTPDQTSKSDDVTGGDGVVIDLARYAQAAEGRNTLTQPGRNTQ